MAVNAQLLIVVREAGGPVQGVRQGRRRRHRAHRRQECGNVA